jgi:hypothetical protein
VNPADQDLTRAVHSWIRTDEHASVERIVDAVLAEVQTTPQGRRRWPTPWSAFSGSPVSLGLAAAAVLVVAVVAVTQVPWSGGIPFGPVGSAEPSTAPSVSARPADVNEIRGLPPEGTTTSDPTLTELVIRHEGSVVAPWTTMWVYADGRLLTSKFLGSRPAGIGDEYIGVVERRLTPEGVEFLRSRALVTGLFDDDLLVADEAGPGGFLELQVQDDGRLVRALWADRGNGWIGQSAPAATAEQQRALTELSRFLTDTAAWPTDVWEDPTPRAYVPSHYALWVRGLPTQVDPDRIWAALPDAAQDVIRAGERASLEWLPDANDLVLLTTDEARSLAAILLGTNGVSHVAPEAWGHWLRFILEDPDRPGNEVWISFSPILPNGDATWLGPG